MTIQQQYQYKYAGQQWDEGNLGWQDLPDHHVFSRVLDYRFRDKLSVPEFVPGWYQYVGVGSTPENSLHYFGTIEEGGLDVDRFDRDYKRYDITPAE